MVWKNGGTQVNVILYSTHCPRCKVLEMKLQKKNISYTENDSVEEMMEMGIQSAPALKVDDKVYLFGEAVKWVNAQEVRV